ncbi:MAG: transposase, partial [Opitutaceae bacterium]|nr:transposase [Opitutaceae bacterium]
MDELIPGEPRPVSDLPIRIRSDSREPAKFVDIHRAQASPIAEEAIGRIARLYAVEKEARGSPPDRRAQLRRTHAAPVFDDLEHWLAMQLTTISG